MSDWKLANCEPTKQSVTQDWQFVQELIEGVIVKEVRSVTTGYGYLTEVYRSDWKLETLGIEQIFQSVLLPGTLSAWHAHEFTTDRIFCAFGFLKLVLYDAREGSPTHGMTNVFGIGTPRPALVVIPPKVWHGVQNNGDQPAAILNAVDRAYQYESPDHWRVDPDSPEIPYSWT